MFARQLRVAARRLGPDEVAGNVIAERGPLDFLAYLLALDEVTGASSSAELLERSAIVTAEALGYVDLLIMLPLNSADAIEVGADEDPELRTAMNDVLIDLVDDADLVGSRLKVAEVVGSPSDRLRHLEALVSEFWSSPNSSGADTKTGF
jgi:hypothetical protein